MIILKKLFTCPLIFILLSGCLSTGPETVDYYEANAFKAEIINILNDENMIEVEEYENLHYDENGYTTGIYKIPVDSITNYNVGQKLKIVVYSNISADVWDLDHLKFEIEEIE